MICYSKFKNHILISKESIHDGEIQQIQQIRINLYTSSLVSVLRCTPYTSFSPIMIPTPSPIKGPTVHKSLRITKSHYLLTLEHFSALQSLYHRIMESHYTIVVRKPYIQNMHIYYRRLA